MSELAAIIRDNLPALVEEYDRRLRELAGYATLPTALRRSAAQVTFDFLVNWLETGDVDDDQRLVDFARQTARERANQGLDASSMHQGLRALDTIIDSWLTEMSDARLFWHAIAKAHEIINHEAADRHSGADSRLRQMVDRSPVGIFHSTSQGRLIDANQAFFRIVGYESLEAVNEIGVPGLYEDPADRQRLIAQLQTGPVTGFETRFRRQDGSLVDVLISVQLIYDEGDTYLEGILEDNTPRRQAEQAIRESQQRLTLVVDSSPLAVIEWNTNFEVVAWNPAAERIFGYTAEEARGRHAAGLIVPDEHREAVDQIWADLLTQQGGARSTNGNITKDGRAIICEWFNTPLIGADNRVFGVASIIQDITGRLRLEKESQESLERRGRQVQTSTEIAQEIATAPELGELFQRVVTLIKERFGYYHAQIFRYDPAQDAVLLVAGYGAAGQKMMAAGHKLTMGRGLVGTAAVIGRSISATDVTVDEYWQPNPNLPDTQGELAVPIKLRDEVLGILDVQSDKAGALGAEDQLLLEGLCGQIAIAIESRRAEEALRQSETHFRAVTESANYAIITANSQGVITNWNHGAQLIFQYTGDEVVGQPLTRLMPERYRTLHLAGIERVSTGGEQHVIGKTVELHALRKTGEEFPIELSLSGWESQEGVFYTAIITDITARREAESQMQETMRELERLYRVTTREGWQTFLQTKPALGYRHDRLGTQPVNAALSPEMEEAIQHNTVVPYSPDRSLAAIPLAVRGAVIGAVGIYDNDPQRPLTPEEMDLVQAISEQGALALESARLFEQTQHDAQRERTINRITSRIRNAPTIEQMLAIAAQELRLETRATRSFAEVSPAAADKASKPDGRGNGPAGDESQA